MMMDDTDMPIAVIGMSCRFPGDATSPEKFWDFLVEGRSAAQEIPKDRFNIDAYYHPSTARQGSIRVRRGHFLKEDIRRFDAPFFSITKAEADATDPQQRLLLEVSYEAFENAGMTMQQLAGSNTSVFSACFMTDYKQISSFDSEYQPEYGSTGHSSALISNRVSWFYDLRGPSMTLDTGCSGSTVAFHLAVESLRRGEATTAVAAGVNLVLAPEPWMSMTSFNFVSPDGLCYAFDHRANGYSRGEGFAAIVLKPLHAAIRDNDTIRAVVRSTSVSQDGKTPGITLPNAEAQASLIRTAYRKAGLDFAQTAFFEAHGTGTVAGDSAELRAIGETFADSRDSNEKLIVGSVKTNIGHLEGCSGLAGILKAILAVEKGLIPANLHYERPHPTNDLDAYRVSIPTVPLSWPKSGVRRASINCFGFGGTIAHVILDDISTYAAEHGLSPNHVSRIPSSRRSSGTDSGIDVCNTSSDDDEPTPSTKSCPRLLVWSSPEQDAVRRNVAMIAEYVTKKQCESKSVDQQILFDNLAYTLGCRRSLFSWRSFAVAESGNDFCNASATSTPKTHKAIDDPRVCFVFTGQGAQWAGMACELFRFPVFMETLQHAEDYLNSLGAEWSVTDELKKTRNDSRIDEPALSQALCTIIQTALVNLLSSWNVLPAVVVGHSSGEIAAAYCSGVITAENAWKLAYHRGRLCASARKGAMMAVGLSAAETSEHCARLRTSGILNVACINSPSSTTVSGDDDLVNALQELLVDEGVFNRKLKVDVAYHSDHMLDIAEEYAKAIGDSDLNPAQATTIPMFSSVTGGILDQSELRSSYFVDNLTHQVQFCEALEAAANLSKFNTVVEIGPHSALQSATKQTLKDINPTMPTYTSMLLRGKDAAVTSLQAAGDLWTRGVTVDLGRVNDPGSEGGRLCLVDLPAYSWNHGDSRSYWHEGFQSRAQRFRKLPRLDLVGSLCPESNNLQMRWRNFIRQKEIPWVLDHKVQNSVLYPAAGMMVAVLEAAQQLADPARPVEGFEMRNVNIGKAMVVPQSQIGLETSLRVIPRQSTGDSYDFELSSRMTEETWQENCTGSFAILYKRLDCADGSSEAFLDWQSHRDTYNAALQRCNRPTQSTRNLYEKFDSLGMKWGPAFQNVSSISNDGNISCATVRIPETARTMPLLYEQPHLLHPATLDAVFQTMVLGSPMLAGVMIPTSIEYAFVANSLPCTPGQEYCGYAKVDGYGLRSSRGDIAMHHVPEEPAIVLRGVVCTALGDSASQAVGSQAFLCSKTIWLEDVDLLTSDQAEKVLRSATVHADAPSTAFTDQLEQVAMLYIRQWLAAMANDHKLELKDHLQQYHRWMAAKSKQSLDRVSPASADWGTPEELGQLVREVRSSAYGEAVCQIGKNLPRIMKGEVSGLEILLENELLYRVYQTVPGVPYMTDQVNKYFDLLGHKTPSMRILEIGAGTGNMTRRTIRALSEGRETPRFGQYCFTDISSGFFENAQAEFSAVSSFMDYKKLDIEQDPLDQGFASETYDVVLASNVLHATRSIDKALANARLLLKPGGTLIFEEIMHPQLSIGLMYGSLPGWWLGEEDGRTGGPTLDEPEWATALRRNGFSDPGVIVRDSPYAGSHVMSAIATTKLRQPSEKHSRQPVIILTPENEPGVEALARRLQRKLSEAWPDVRVRTFMKVSDGEAEGSIVVSLIELRDPIVSRLTEQSFNVIRRIVTLSHKLLWLVHGAHMETPFPHAASVLGLLRTLRYENSQLKLHTIDLSANAQNITELQLDAVQRTLYAIAHVEANAQEYEYVEKDGKVLIPRVVPSKAMNDAINSRSSSAISEEFLHSNGQKLKLEIGAVGHLDTLRFAQDSTHTALGPGEVEIQVMANAVHPIDAETMLGQTTSETFGGGFAGIVTAVGPGMHLLQVGNRVATFQPGSLQTNIVCQEEQLCVLPGNLSFSEAASMALDYTTAYHLLVKIARIEGGEKILVDDAASPLGQATLQLALHLKAQVSITVERSVERGLLSERYAIPLENVVDKHAKAGLAGHFDVVVTQDAEITNQIASQVAEFGTLIRILPAAERILVKIQSALPMQRNTSTATIDMESMRKHKPRICAGALRSVFDLAEAGHLKPPASIVELPYSQVHDAFTQVQQPENMDCLVLSAKDGDLVPVVPKDKHPLENALRPDATYVLVGGLGGLGQSIAHYLVKHGVKYLAFWSRSGGKSEDVQGFVRSLEGAGAICARAFACDVSDKDNIQSTLCEGMKDMPPVKGVIQAAMVLRDALFENMTYDDWTAATIPKIQGSWNLHELLPNDMDFFLLLSSIAGTGGMQSQANYAAGNTFQDALAYHRRAKGLPAVCIDLTVVLGVGFVSENTDLIGGLKQAGVFTLQEEQLHALIKCAITGYSTDDHRTPAQIITGVTTGGHIAENEIEDAMWSRDNRFSFMTKIGLEPSSSGTEETVAKLETTLPSAKTLDEAVSLVAESLVAKLAKALAMPVEDLDTGRSVSDYGVDSLVAVELRNWIQTQARAAVSIFDLMSAIPITALARKIASESSLVGAKLRAEMEG